VADELFTLPTDNRVPEVSHRFLSLSSSTNTSTSAMMQSINGPARNMGSPENSDSVVTPCCLLSYYYLYCDPWQPLYISTKLASCYRDNLCNKNDYRIADENATK